MNGEEILRSLVNQAFTEARLRHPQYSLRSFSKRLGVSSSSVSEFLRGKRSYSKKIAVRILKKISAPPQKTQEVLSSYETKISEKILKIRKRSSQKTLELKADQYELISRWEHFAILSLVQTEGFQETPQWIGRRLGIHPREARSALDRLIRLELLRRNSKGKLLPTYQEIFSSDEIKNPSLQRAHLENLNLARNALETINLEDRYFTAVTLTLNPKKLREAKKALQDFRKQFCIECEKTKKKEVYKLCFQFFPLTRKEVKP